METKVSYAVVGAFVLVLSAAVIGAVLWISSGRAAGKSYATYLAYFTESVSGLNRQAPVKYKGVEVGAVQEISLDPKDPQRVELVLGIERRVPIKEDTVAVLSVQGLTGIAFVDLEGGSLASPLLAAKEPSRYPIIATRPSLLRRLDTAVSALVADVSQTAQSINQLLDKDTRAALQRSIRDFESAAHVVAARSEAIDASLVNGARASARLTGVVEQIGRSAEAVGSAAAETFRAAEAVRGAAGDAASGLAGLRAGALPELQRLIAEARAVAASLGRVTQKLERDPSALLTGREATPLGPGE